MMQGAQRTRNSLQDERYRIQGRIGRGGMAAVFRAYDRVERRPVALKVLRRPGSRGSGDLLSDEFEAWSRLSHPNIVRAHAFAVSHGGPIPRDTPYLVLELVNGGPADRAFDGRRGEPLAIEALAIELLRGLRHVHERGLIHRDLKPGNVLIGRGTNGRRTVKLTDFGLAARAGVRERPGTVSGSLPYVAPEGLLGVPLDGRADLYGLGILLFQLAVGVTPLTGANVGELLRWHLTGPPADPGPHRPDFPGYLSRFVRQLTMRRRDDRPAGAAAALRLLLASSRAPLSPATERDSSFPDR